MKAVICILILFSTMPVFSQTVGYVYDASGNCRTRTVTPPAMKSSPAPPELQQEEQTPEEEKTVTALPDVVTEKDFLIYPNPTYGHFTLEINHLPHDMKGEAYLLDSNGRLIETKSIHSHHLHKKLEFNLSHKTAGVYMLNIHLENSAFTWKIIKK